MSGANFNDTDKKAAAAADAKPFVNKTANYTLTDAEEIVTVQIDDMNNIDITFPTAVGRAGKKFTVLRHGSGMGSMQLQSTSSQTFNGESAPKTTAENYATRTYVSDGSNWLMLNTIGTDWS